ncbi:MAG: thiol reductant ABC exporter subunit CydD [Eggerthellaceae bacterium]
MIDKMLFTLPGIRRTLALLFSCAIIRAGLIIAQAFTLSIGIVSLWQGKPLADALGFLLAFFACFVGNQLVVFLEDRFIDRYAATVSDSLREKLIGGIVSSRGRIVRTQGTASITAAALEGTEQVRIYLKTILPKMVNVVVIPLALFIAALTQDLISAVIMLVLFPVIVFYMVLLGNAAKRRAERQYASYQVMSNHFIDTLRGLDTLRAFGAARRHAREIFKVSERFRKATIETLRVATLSGAVLDLIATVGVGAIALMLGFRLLDGSIALLPSLIVLVLAPEYFRPIRDFASDFHASLDGKNALANIVELIGSANLQPEGGGREQASDTDTAHVGTRKHAPADDETAPASAQQIKSTPAVRCSDAGESNRTAPDPEFIAPWGAGSELRIEDLAFRYPDADTDALDGISFSITGMANVGIIGASGSGKSTLASLLGGFDVPTRGRIVADDVAVAHLQRADWQRQVLYIPQHPYLFHTTLQENLTFYSPTASEEAVQQAIATVGLESLVDRLPDGLDTVIGDGGRGLSGGQAQRIALARALLDPSRHVLVFDEPTAHLDIETEWELKQRMLPLMEGHLVLFATHRLHWLADMDYLLVLDKGRIVAQGTPDEVLSRGTSGIALIEHLKGGGHVE